MIMDRHDIIVIGGLTVAFLVSVYILWGPSPISKRKKGQITGLVNLGRTCFLNTLLQALASCALFMEWLDQHESEAKKLTSSLRKVLWILNGGSELSCHSPEEVLSVLKSQGWVVPAGEQDAHELFHCIVSTLQEENKSPRPIGSLSDALPASDTLSQASDILDDPFEVIVEGESNSSAVHVEEPSEMSGKSLYEDAETSPDGDSASRSLSGPEFYSADSGGTLKDGSDETLKFRSPMKPNLSKVSDKLRSSQESIQRGVYSQTGASSSQSSCTKSPPFQGLLASSLQCYVCGNASSVRTDTFDSLSLALGEATTKQRTLNDLLRQFVRTEIIPDVDCAKCGKKTHALKTYNFGKLPPCLCLHIVRTAWNSSSGTSSKRQDHVEYPEYLVMDPFTWKPGPSPPSPPPATSAKHLYRLKSVVIHVGGVDSGHFLTFRRGPLNSTIRYREKGEKLKASYADSARWYMASDEIVESSTMAKAMDSLAYMLFYEKCSSDILSTLLGESKVVN